MRKSFALLTSALALLLGVLPAGAIIDAALQMQLGNPSGATADPNNHKGKQKLRLLLVSKNQIPIDQF